MNVSCVLLGDSDDYADNYAVGFFIWIAINHWDKRAFDTCVAIMICENDMFPWEIIVETISC